MQLAVDIERVVAAARRRAVAALVLEQGGWAVAAGCGALIVLLLVGTQVLQWYWVVGLMVLTGVVGWWRSRKRVPGAYEVAQRVDAALGLKDLISTAYFFGGRSGELVERVRREAEDAARGADATAAVPLSWPRSGWPALALALAALGVFGVRYGMLRTLDLRPPLAQIRFDTLTGAPKPEKEARERRQAPGAMPEPFQLEMPEGERADLLEKDNVVQESLRTTEVRDPNQVGRQGQAGEKSAAEDQNGEDSEEGESASGDKKQAPAGAKDGRPGGEQGKQGPQEKNSLMDKMRDALANLMDKMKMEPKGEGKESASAKSSQKGQKSDKGQPQPGSKQDGQPDASQPGDQKGDSDQSQQAKSNAPGNSQEQPTKNEKSGIGKSDGRKDIELAEQQKALGKLSELLGKRSLNLQGEVMVEVSNSKNQQLKTPYVNKTATHMEAGGEIHRDEVPLHLQEYVQRYYEQVRKQPVPGEKQ